MIDRQRAADKKDKQAGRKEGMADRQLGTWTNSDGLRWVGVRFGAFSRSQQGGPRRNTGCGLLLVESTFPRFNLLLGWFF